VPRQSRIVLCTTMSPPVLPQEIYNLIVDTVAQDMDAESNRQTLWACTMASRVLLRRSYHHLVSYIHIHLDLNSTGRWECETTLTDFILLLRSSLRLPDVGIARYLRGFELSIRPPVVDPDSMPFALVSITYSLSRLFRAVYSLTRVEHLKLSAVNSTLSLKKHESDPSLYSVADDLVDLCHSPTLSSLALSNFTGVPTSLLRDSRIKHIEMSNVSFSRHSREHWKFVHQTESISVDGACFLSVLGALHGGGGPISGFFRCQEAFAHLRTLELRSNGVDDLPQYLKMAATAANTLDTFYLHIFADESTIRPLLRSSKESSRIPKYFFHFITNLTTLRISFHHNLTRGSHSPQYCFIKPLRHLLNISTFPSSLETLDIGAKSSVHINKAHEIECACRPTTQLWGLLDSVLTKPLIGSIPRLQLFIKFCVDLDEGCSFDEDLFNTQTCIAIGEVLPDFRDTRLFPLKGDLYVISSDQQDSDSLGFM
jgi:hypothetical protein